MYYHAVDAGGVFGLPSTGSWGVDIFFVISGFIICTISVQDNAHFFRRRVLRVVPLYWIATFGWIMAMLVMPGRVNSTHVDAGGIVRSLLFIPYQMPQRDGPILQLGWTLNYEMFFYLVVAVLLTVFARNARRALIAAAIVIGLLSVSGFFFPASAHFLSFYQSSLLLEFVAGVGLSFAYRRFSRTEMNVGGGSRLRILFFGTAAALAIAALVVLVWHDLQFGARTDVSRAFFYGVPALVLVASSLALESLIRDGRTTRVLLEVGDGSYAVYLFHPFVLAAVSHVILADVIASAGVPMRILLLAGTMVLVIVAGIVINRWIDAPIQRFFRRRFSR